MPTPPRIGLLAAALLAACTIAVEQREGDGSPEAECLDLFETCVELAGESPGCTEVYLFCEGSVVGTGTGGTVPTGGCEQDYVDCLQGGGSPDECQPLLDMCDPPDPTEPTPTTGACPLGDPSCGGDGSTSSDDSGPGCPPDDPDCGQGSECEALFLACVEQFADEPTCLEMQQACQNGDCDGAEGICTRAFVDEAACAELTNCSGEPPPTSDCEDIRATCESEGLLIGQCSIQNSGAQDCFPEVDACTWYQGECQEQFVSAVCFDAIDACISGLLPSPFDCNEVLAEGCTLAGLSDGACNQAHDSCQNGFNDIKLCAETPIYDSPFDWLNQIAICNGWEN